MEKKEEVGDEVGEKEEEEEQGPSAVLKPTEEARRGEVTAQVRPSAVRAARHPRPRGAPSADGVRPDLGGAVSARASPSAAPAVGPLRRAATPMEAGAASSPLPAPAGERRRRQSRRGRGGGRAGPERKAAVRVDRSRGSVLGSREV